MAEIERIHARQILDSRGNPTVEVEVTLASGAVGRAAVPSGASTGEFEATELRDGGEHWAGKGVTEAVANANGEIAEALRGADAADQAALDRTMIDLDGTPNKSRLGANAILGVSLAAARAAAADAGLPLYRYVAGSAAGPEPSVAARADDERGQRWRARRQLGRLPGVHGRARRARRASPRACGSGTEVFHALKRTLDEQGHSTAVGDEGGFAPEPGVERGGAGGAGRRDRRRRATRRARTSSSPSTRRPARSTRTAPTCSSTRAAR